jgi:23S rRNA G2069 N7-methylase RlmK/C1962 C5-methylase RlmI
MLAARIKKNERRLGARFRAQGTDAYRVYDADIPELPLAVDRYADHLVVTEKSGVVARDDAAHAKDREALANAAADALGVAHEKVAHKVRFRRRPDDQPAPLDERDERIVVREHHHRFVVDVWDRLDTGLYLDLRALRARVGKEARDARVLNLYGYTGAFTVHAAKGGARSSTTVDLSRRALDVARANLVANDVDLGAHELVRADVDAFLARDTRMFDLVIVNPPSFSRSHGAARELDVQRDHPALIEATLPRLARGGRVYFATHLRAFAPRFPADLSVEDLSSDIVDADFRASPLRVFALRR